MPTPVNIRDAESGVAASVTPNGELIVSPVTPNVSSHHTMNVIDTAYNFAPIISGKKMILQNVLIYGNKNVGPDDATVVIYTADDPESLTPIDIILEFEIPKYGSRDITSLNLDLGEGVYFNAKTDDNDIYLTMMGYYTEV